MYGAFGHVSLKSVIKSPLPLNGVLENEPIVVPVLYYDI